MGLKMKNFHLKLNQLLFATIVFCPISVLYIRSTQDLHIKLVEKPNFKFSNNDYISYHPRSDRFNIFLIWYGANFPEIYSKSLETIVYHHPNADILLFSNELNESLIEPFRKKGYNNIHIVRFDLARMVHNKPGSCFAQKAIRILNGEDIMGLKLTPVHLSDFLRYFLVYEYGGLYIDTDSFVLKNMEHLRNTIGVTENRSYICSSKTFNTKNLSNFTCISNGIFHFDRHHPFMKDALNDYDLWWSKHQGYAPAGAIMLMELIEKNFDKINFQSQREILCFHHLSRALMPINDDDTNLNDAMNVCYSIQILGAGRAEFNVDNFNKTFVGKIYEKFKVL